MTQSNFLPNSIPLTWPTDNSPTIMLLRLIIGCDIIAETEVEAEAYCIKNPMVIQGAQIAGSKVGRLQAIHILLIPWVPLASTPHDLRIDRNHVLFATPIAQNLQDYYRTCVEHSKHLLKNSQFAFGVDLVDTLRSASREYETDQHVNDDENPPTFH